MGDVNAGKNQSDAEADVGNDARVFRPLSVRKKALYYLLMIVMSIAVTLGAGETLVRLLAIDRPIPLMDREGKSLFCASEDSAIVRFAAQRDRDLAKSGIQRRS